MAGKSYIMNPASVFTPKLWAAFSTLTPAKKISLLTASMLPFLCTALFIYWTGNIEYGVLFSRLTNEDVGSIVSKLQAKKVPYRLSPSGDSISVPAEMVSELRLEMATDGLSQGSRVGETFNTKKFGTTEFEQQLNYRRALQEELTRTINSLGEIQHSRVHLAISKDSPFMDQQKKATASVIIRLKPGRTLRPEQVDGIIGLVARSVEGISPEDVIIIDSKGNILSSVQSELKLEKMTNTQIEYQRTVERETELRIQTLLENVVGKGRAVVRVSADMDFRIVEKMEENFAPDSHVIRRIKKQSEKTASPATGKATSLMNNKSHEKLNETTNYEVNRVVNKIIMPMGEIRKLSIAVLIDGIYSKNDNGVDTYQPRAKKVIDALEELVKKSAGINTSRGDQIVVTEMPFSKVEAMQDQIGSSEWQERLVLLSPLIKYSAGLLVLTAIFMFGIRPIIREILVRTVLRNNGMLHQAQENAALKSAPQSISREDRNLTDRDVAKKLADADAKKFADILRIWLR
jgi:flagellar M-ring protein FliF